MAYTVTNNSPSAGSIAWTNIHIVYQGVDYTISNNSTNLKYVYWQLSTPTQLTASDTYPILGPNDSMVFFNRNGVATSVLDSTITDGALIVPGTITAEAISAGAISTGLLAANAVTTDKIAADSVTASKLLVTGQGKALNRDPACQDSSTWIQGGSPGTFGVLTEATSPVGSTVIRAVGGVQFFDQKNIPISAGTQYKVSMWARQTAGTGLMYLRLYCYDASGGLVAYQVTGITPVTTSFEGIDVPTTWTKYVGYITPPATSVNAKLIVHVNWTNDGTTDCTDIRVEEYIGADLIVDGAITADKLAANSVVAGKIAAGAVEANTLAAGAVTADAVAAGAITTNKLLVVPESICPDPTFLDTAFWGGGRWDAGGWTVETAAPSNISYLMNVPRSLVLQSGVVDRKHVWSSKLPFSGTGQSLRLRFKYANNSGQTCVVAVWCANVGGGSEEVFGAAFGHNGGTFGTYNSIATIPAGTKTIEILVYNDGSVATTGQCYVSDIRLDLAASADLIVDGAVTADKIAANAITAGKIAAGAISATEIAAGAISTNKLLVQPTSLCPDPYFADEAWWASTLLEPLGWYYEAGHADRIQVPKVATLWSGHPTNVPGGDRKHIWSGNVTVPPTGTQLRLRAIIRNNSNQDVSVNLRFYDVGGTMVGADIYLTSTATSGLQTLNAIGIVPNTAATCRFIIYNAGDTSFSGAVHVSGVMLDVAASADLIVDGAITAVKIAADTITGDKIAANAITASELATNAVTADKITAGAITTAKIAAGAVTATEIAAGTITADKIAADTITGDKIAANTITAAEIDSRGLSIKDAAGNVILAAGSALDFANVGGATKPAANATNDLNLVLPATYTRVGNTIYKNGPGATNTGYDMAHSKSAYLGGAYVKSAHHGGHNGIGLSDTAFTVAPGGVETYTTIDYWFHASYGTWYVYENGVSIVQGALAAGDEMSVTYDGSYVRYLKNGVAVRTVAAPAGLSLYAVANILYTDERIEGFGCGPLTSNNWASVGGSGKPADNATNDLNMIVPPTFTMSGNRLTKTSGSGGWNETAFSKGKFLGAAFVEATYSTPGYWGIGLDSDPVIASAYAYVSSPYWLHSSNNEWAIYENGGYTANGGPGSLTAGDVLGITFDGTRVRYLKNGAVLREVVDSTYANTALHAVAHISDVGGFVDKFRCGYLTSNNWSAVGGDGKPQDNATVGATWGGNLIGQPADNQLMNNQRDGVVLSVPTPVGGAFNGGSPDMVGRLRIRLPQGFTSTMVKFSVDIYEYAEGRACTLEIGGYAYGYEAKWINVTARVTGDSNVEYPVYFGMSSGKACIWIGNENEQWQYPVVRVRNFTAGFGGTTEAMWATGWEVGLTTESISGPDLGEQKWSSSVVDTLPGADWSKVSGSGRPENGATVGADSTNIKVGNGTNLLPNTEFGGRQHAPVTLGNNPSGSTLNNEFARMGADVSPWTPPGRNALVIQQGNPTDTVQGADAYLNGAYGQKATGIPVVAGKRYELSAKMAAHRCSVGMGISWFDNSGAQLGETILPLGHVQEGGEDLSGWTHTGIFGTAPAGAVFASVWVRKGDTAAGNSSSFFWICEPFFGEANAVQTTWSVYSPGTPRGALAGVNQITAGNASTYIADLAVGTLQLADQAVTLPVAVTNVRSLDHITGVSSYDIIASSLNVVSTGAPCIVFMTWAHKLPSASGYPMCELLVDGVAQYRDASLDAGFCALNRTLVLSPGAHLIQLRLYNAIATNTFRIGTTSLTYLELKK